MKRIFTFFILLSMYFNISVLPLKAQQQNETILSGHTNEMIFIRGGTFAMGDNFNEGLKIELPVHFVTLNDFYMSKYEVTVKMFKQFIDESGFQTKAEMDGGSYIWTGTKWEKKKGINWMYDAGGKLHDSSGYNHPVVHISWYDAKSFCEWLSKKTGKNFRLPYEAEWEYAARCGGKKYKYSWGDKEPNGTQCNFADVNTNFDWSVKDINDGYRFTSPVGSYPANELGIYDLTGNAWEWCEDWYKDNYYTIFDAVNPKGPNIGKYHVIRGGSWNIRPMELRVTSRFPVPLVRERSGGIRLVRTD